MIKYIFNSMIFDRGAFMQIHPDTQLKQKQSLKLMITPEMRQHIQLLQFSSIELMTYIQEQQLENPMLEIDDELAEINNRLRYLNEDARSTTSYGASEQAYTWENHSSSSNSLADFLEDQLLHLSLDTKQKKLCQYLIGNLNEHGYLELDHSQLIQNKTEFEISLSILQSLEPIGVGARTLAECIELQLRHQPEPNELAIRIAHDFLPEVANGKGKQIASVLHVDVLAVQCAIDAIKRCNPRPCANFSSATTVYVYPDVTVKQINGSLHILLDKQVTSNLRIHEKYQKLLHEAHQDQEVIQYVKRSYQSALSFMKGLEQRNQTIYRVTEVIVREQQRFFHDGSDHLKPLTLKRVAEELGLHESTISRATQNKYMQTPHGLFAFRFFFPTGIQSNIASYHVQKQLQQLIKQETKTSPLSDQKLADLLQEKGMSISRRTVTKYREQLGIASSSSRKRYAIS
jgi:RNA polymerase sigma-54 factor